MADENTNLFDLEKTYYDLEEYARQNSSLYKLTQIALKQEDAEKLNRKRSYLQQKISDLQATLDKAAYNEASDIKMQILHYEKELDRTIHELEEIQTELANMNESLEQKTHYDKRTVFKNIRWGIKTNPNVKLGQIEREAKGCQPGYSSKLEKPENTTEPSLDFVVTASQRLNIPIDLLVNSDLAELSPTERYLLNFFAKLEKDTADDKLDWISESAHWLNNLGVDEHFETEHEMFCMDSEEAVTEMGEKYNTLVSRFISKSFDNNTTINGDCYHLLMANNTTLYLMNIKKQYPTAKESTPDKAIEIWMHQKGAGRTFICSTQDQDPLRTAIFNLYNFVGKRTNHPKVKPDLKEVIDAFMNNDILGDSSVSK